MSFLVELPQSEFDPHAFAQFAPSSGFTGGNALAMAWMSQLAYETRLPDKVRAIGDLWDLAEVHVVQQQLAKLIFRSYTNRTRHKFSLTVK